MAGKLWTEEEIELLKTCDGKTIEELKTIFPQRSKNSLRNKYMPLGIRILGKNDWTDNEIQILKDNEYKTMPELSILLPNRNDIGIRVMASKIKVHIISRRVWTPEEIKIVTNAHNKLTLSQTLELLPNRTKHALKDYAKENKIKFKRPTVWTKEDIGLLKEKCNGKIKLNEIYKLFPDREFHTVNKKIHQLGLRHLVISYFKEWTSKEDEFILKNYYSMKSKDIAEYFNVFQSTITERAKFLGLDKKTVLHPFNEDELEILNSIKDDCLPLNEICTMFPDKPIYSIRSILKKMDIKYNKLDYYSSDGNTKLRSTEERNTFDFIRCNFNVDIGISNRVMFKNSKYNEGYIPDFIINTINSIQLDKSIIMEYYGLYRPDNSSDFIQTYVAKTHRKNEYYNSNPDIYFIDLYPTDLKNNFEGVRNRLTSFFMDNFNINIVDLKEAS